MRTANKAYWALWAGEVIPPELVPLTQWFRWWPQWNPIWIHRVLIECCRWSWDEQHIADQGAWADHLKGVRRELAKQWDTTVAGRESNKSFTHYLALCTLDAAVGDPQPEPFERLLRIWNDLGYQCLWREGVHYGLFVYGAVLRAMPLLVGVWPKEKREELIERFCEMRDWLALVQNEKGILPAIGDGWPELDLQLEESLPASPGGSSLRPPSYLRVHRCEKWLVIENRRPFGPCYHEHCESDGILISYDGRWLLPGDGCPTWFRKMLRPDRWDRPGNHWGTQRWWEYPVFWRLKRRTVSRRNVFMIGRRRVDVCDPGHVTVRWPGVLGDVKCLADGAREWTWNGLNYWVSGRSIEAIKKSHAWITTSYKRSEKWPVVRVRGHNLLTIITPAS